MMLQGKSWHVPYNIVRELFQVPATVPFGNMIKWIPFLVTKRISFHVEAGSLNQCFLTFGTAVWVLFVGATDGFIVLLTGTFVVASSVRRTNVVMRNWKGTSRPWSGSSSLSNWCVSFVSVNYLLWSVRKAFILLSPPSPGPPVPPSFL